MSQIHHFVKSSVATYRPTCCDDPVKAIASPSRSTPHHLEYVSVKMEFKVGLDYVSVPAFLIAFVLHMLMGMIWYHPKMFGTAFLRLAHGGRKQEPDAKAMKAAAAGTLIAMPFFSFLLSVVGCKTAGEGSLWGFAFGFFFDSGLNVSHSFFEDRPFALFVLHRGYHVISLSLIGAILGFICGPTIESL